MSWYIPAGQWQTGSVQVLVTKPATAGSTEPRAKAKRRAAGESGRAATGTEPGTGGTGKSGWAKVFRGDRSNNKKKSRRYWKSMVCF